MSQSKETWENAKDFICPGLVESFNISRNPSLAKCKFRCGLDLKLTLL